MLDSQVKQRVIQEYVPGKQVTLAHTIASPKKDIYQKMGLDDKENLAIGILNITPGEGTIIAADIATKSANIEIGFLDRFTGTLLITGDISSVKTALEEASNFLNTKMGFAITELTNS